MERKEIMKIVLLIVGVVALLYVVNLYMSKNNTSVENFEEEVNSVEPTDTMGLNEVYGEVNASSEAAPVEGLPTDSFPKDQLNATDLLPGSADNSAWGHSIPSSGTLGDGNFLTAGYHSGVNTIGQSLKNANRQLRSEPANPQVKVSPWMQSTISPDTNRQPLEIGNSTH